MNIYKNGRLVNSVPGTFKDPNYTVGGVPKMARNNSYLAKSNWPHDGLF